MIEFETIKDWLKDWLNDWDNLIWLNKSLCLELKNNAIYKLVSKDYNYRLIDKKECLKLKIEINENVILLIKKGIKLDTNIVASIEQIKKAMIETDFYPDFYNYFTSNLNGETINAERLRSALIGE